MNFIPVVAEAETTVITTVAEAPGADAAAQNAAQPAGGAFMQMLPLILIFAVFLFFMNRSSKKQAAKRQQMLDKIVKGSKVLLNSGMFGAVAEVREKSYLVEISDKVLVEVVKNGVAEVVEEETEAKNK